MDTVYKIIEDCEVKKIGERQYEFTASTSDIDRDGESILATGWDLKNFKKNPVLMFAHDYRTLPIGKVPRVWTSKDGTLKNTVQFPPEGTYEFADIVERLVDTGYLKTESVGFIPKEWDEGDGEKSPRRTYTKQELLEISIVPVPSNPNALMNAVTEGVITTKQFKHMTQCLATEEATPDDNTDVKKPKEVSQEEIKDEIDYLTLMIDEQGLSDSAIESLKELMKRLPGDDIPVKNIEVELKIKDLPEVQGVIDQANQIIDEERLKYIIEQTVKYTVLRSK